LTALALLPRHRPFTAWLRVTDVNDPAAHTAFSHTRRHRVAPASGKFKSDAPPPISGIEFGNAR
jgi:hypothetical protein